MGGRYDGTTYPTLAAAIKDWGDKIKDAYYIRMINHSTEDPITVDKNVYVDLNGYTVTADVKVNATMTFYGFDTTTNGYVDAEYGHIIGEIGGSGKMATVTITEKNQTTERMRYLMLQEPAEDGETDTSFHRFNMEITNVIFRPSAAGIYFESTFYGDQAVGDAIAEWTENGLTYGLFLTLADDVKSPDDPDAAAAAHDPANWVSGGTGETGDKHQGSIITGVVEVDNPDNAQRTNTPIYVSTYFNFEGQSAGLLADNMRSITLTEVIRRMVNQYGRLNETQKAGFDEFLRKFGDLYSDATVPGIGAILEQLKQDEENA